MILSCQNITKTFVDKTVLRDISFHIEDQEKAAIVGINGAGKSTLLKIIMNEMEADNGLVTLSKGKTIGYLAQHQEQAFHNTIYDEMLSVKQEIIDLDRKIRQLEQNMSGLSGTELEQVLNLYTKATHRFEQLNGYAYKSEITGVLKGLGFKEEEFSKRISTLSGGQKTRVALGKLLLSKPDIILLDEPTNHLDMNSISWLETFLMNYHGAVLIVSHDRYFLDKVVTKIIEISNTHARTYRGNYSDFVAKRDQIRAIEWKEYEKQQQEIKHQEEVITKLKQFNREKSIKRAESREKMLDRIERIERPVEIDTNMKLKLEPSTISGSDVLTVEELSKSYGNHTLFKDLNFEIKRGEKVALIGENGTGKTTILKIINKYVSKDTGIIRLGSRVKIGYYDQEQQVLHDEKTIFQEISDSYPSLTNTRIRNVLAAFLFRGEDVFKLIKSLSGGERGRVSLAKLMLSSANFLILDEPTNHLDIFSKEVLEDALSQYTGTVFYVSHDRYFINKTATRILELNQEHLDEYKGNYDYYLQKKEESQAREILSASTTPIESEKDSEVKLDWKQQKEEQAKLRKQANAIKKLEEKIADLEDQSSALDEEIALPENASNSDKLMELTAQKAHIDETLLDLYDQWEALSE
ncbi:ABC transporter [Anaerostipes sp. 992a]|uniref:ribosomal protection-like ABC-F family protein n=1 Tax=Anaerostipes sp. 992a TaxID=1261637 RepID=UPI0009512DA0|nr:ABC-F family ATP-binding cassette domain-containing protein [Anaerostipes sp. 992a]MDD5968921.1 ABC-F family ATP-binding cassette domain-containing protein [Anaerostipes sp.]OLR62064.1 ABC transporter [Anaerostipes sp. 992a]